MKQILLLSYKGDSTVILFLPKSGNKWLFCLLLLSWLV